MILNELIRDLEVLREQVGGSAQVMCMDPSSRDPWGVKAARVPTIEELRRFRQGDHGAKLYKEDEPGHVSSKIRVIVI